MSAASPGVIELWLPNGFYASTEEYVFALAEAMKTEYDAIHAAGLTIQLDCPDIPGVWSNNSDLTVEEFRAQVAMRLAAIDHAIRDIPGEAVRLHICWGNYQGPHVNDVLPGGRPGDPDSDEDWFVTDWMDTTRAQQVLSFQHHSWPDMLAEMHSAAGWRRYPMRVVGPLVRQLLKRRAAYRHTPGRYADPWGAIRGELGEPRPDTASRGSA